jgi:hypothetical protein
VSIYRAYEVDSAGISISGTSLTPALYIAAAAAADCNVVKLKVAVEGASSPSPPSNGSVLFTLNKVTGAVGGGATVTASPTGQSSLAAQTTFKSGSTALTGLTQSTEYWATVIPFTTGAQWSDDFENTGLEVNVPASGTYAVYFTAAAGAGSGCNARVMLWFAE